MDGRLDEATEAYARALAKDPESVYLLKELAELSARQGRLDDALGYAERAFALTPDDEVVRLFLGTLYRMRKDVEGARRVLLGADGLPVAPDAALLVYGVATWDPMSFLAAAALLVGIALLATLVPALRAARIAPVEAIRDD